MRVEVLSSDFSTELTRGLFPEGPEKFSGARFSKDPITYWARKAIFNDLYLRKKVVYRH